MPEDVEKSESLPGRTCGTCTLCCKVLSITELQKPQGRWCQYCDTGRGCKIYEQRPDECATFHCGYLSWELAGDHWFPARSKMVIVAELDGARVAVHVDPGRPNAWRQEPFYSELKEWSVMASHQMHQVVVCIGSRAIVVLPDRDVDLGVVAEDERIMTAERLLPSGLRRLEALKLKADDPRIAGMIPGKPFVPKANGK
jgi:hypothetical protein